MKIPDSHYGVFLYVFFPYISLGQGVSDSLLLKGKYHPLFLKQRQKHNSDKCVEILQTPSKKYKKLNIYYFQLLCTSITKPSAIHILNAS